jgi:pSer/pThr/pTyr-binding forkhead associated (FHA) protein
LNCKKEKIATENEFQDMIEKNSVNNNYNLIDNLEENKYDDYILKSEMTNSGGRINTLGNNQVSFNCNCIGKYSYKNTEAITIINNNINQNNHLNTYYSTEGKTIDKTETQTKNKITNSKTKKDLNNKISTLSKSKTYNKTNSNNNQIIKTNFTQNKTNQNKDEPEKLCLDLEILNSWNLPIGLQLHIDKYGLKNSIRNEKDGITYFGFQSEEELNTNPNIDYLLGPKDQDYDEQFIGKHFQIRFDDDRKKYYIKDLGNGFGTFIKLIREEKIKDNLLINIGETYIVFSFNEDNENDLIIKLFTGEEQRNSYTFNCDNQKCIIIGRDSSLCDIIIDDKMLSRVHCCINYKEKDNIKGWYIKDGNLQGKKSTNDTWFYSAEETLIYDQMIFKTNHNLFKCICK